jgi:hypothetical protein
MSDRLTMAAVGRGLRQVLPQVLVSLVLLEAAGALAGVVWVWLWTPPTGVVVDHQWVQDESGLRGDFSATGSYVAVAAVTGLVIAVLLGVLFDKAEIVNLLVVLAGSVLAGWVMYRVGIALSPADPRSLADSVKDGTRLPGRLAVNGVSPFKSYPGGAFPGGAMLGLVIVYFGLPRRRGNRD